MRFGVCTGIELAPLLAEVGYDYIELGVASDLIPDEDEEAWTEKRRQIQAMPLRPEAFISFVRTGKIVGPAADPVRLRRYVHTALRRAAEVGGQVVVFGSGGARQIPEGFARTDADQQILDFLGYCADAADETGVVVAIEPLCREECNLINLVSEGAELARKLDRPGVRNLADTFHMEKENEPVSVIVKTADVLAHVHTANSGRGAPGTGIYDHVEFFRALRAAHYNAHVAIECNWRNNFEAQVGPSLEHLKAAYARSLNA